MRKLFVMFLFSCIMSNLSAQTWAELGTGMDALQAGNRITSLVTDHTGNVYAAGSFADGQGYYIVSKWDGASWTAVGELGNVLPIQTNCLAIDSADNVYVTYEGLATPKMLMKWNGTAWSHIGPPSSMGTFGPLALDKNKHIYANRYTMYTEGITYYAIDEFAGSDNWTLLGGITRKTQPFNFCMAFNSVPNAITIDPSGNVYAGGSFQNNVSDTSGLSPAPVLRVVKYDGMKWSVLENGQEDLGMIMDLAADNAGNIYAASKNTDKNYVAKWNGTSWTELGTGSNALHANGDIITLALDKSGNVYAAGDFTNAAGLRYVAHWDGASWKELGTGTAALAANAVIYDVTTDAAGNVYAAGNFTNTNGDRYVAKWSLDETLGVQSKSAAKVVPVYPNPSDGFSQIVISEDVELTVHSAIGEPLKTFYVPAGTSTIDLSMLPDGLYMLVCKGKTTDYASVKFIKE